MFLCFIIKWNKNIYNKYSNWVIYTIGQIDISILI